MPKMLQYCIYQCKLKETFNSTLPVQFFVVMAYEAQVESLCFTVKIWPLWSKDQLNCELIDVTER